MKLAVFGDIHSNHIALEACMAEAQKQSVDGILFLGDYVSDCADPQQTMALLRDIASHYRCWFIRGNREEYLIDHADGKNEWKDNSQSGSLLYTYENLTLQDIEWFRSLPIAMKIEIEGTPAFEICHGAPDRSRAMLLPGREDFNLALAQMETNLLLCAHTHETFVTEKDGKTIANGGSLGLPCDDTPGASFLLLELIDGRWIPQLHRVSYDAEAVIREFSTSGFMKRGHVWARTMAHTIRTGHNYTLDCIALTEQYAKAQGLPFDTEALWEQAARKLNVP